MSIDGAAPPRPWQAEVERGDHLVLALLARVDVDQGAQAVEAQHGEAGLGERAEVAAGALHPQQLDVGAGRRVDVGALGGRVAAGVVRVAGVGAEPVRPVEQLVDDGSGSRAPPGLGAADPLGDDPLGVAARAGTPPIGSAGSPRAARHSARSARTSV